jgi:hypothetical protein
MARQDPATPGKPITDLSRWPIRPSVMVVTRVVKTTSFVRMIRIRIRTRSRSIVAPEAMVRAPMIQNSTTNCSRSCSRFPCW